MEVAANYVMQAGTPAVHYMHDASNWYHVQAQGPAYDASSHEQTPSSDETVLPLNLVAMREGQPRRLFRSKSCGTHEDSPHTSVAHSAVKFKRTFVHVMDSPAATHPPMSYATPHPSPYADYGTTFRHRDFDGTYFHNPFDETMLLSQTPTIAENEPWFVNAHYGHDPFATVADYVNATPSTSGVSISETTDSIKSSPGLRRMLGTPPPRHGIPHPQRVPEDAEQQLMYTDWTEMATPPGERYRQDGGPTVDAFKDAQPMVFKTAGQRRRYYRDLKMKRLREEAIAQGNPLPATKKKERRRSVGSAAENPSAGGPSVDSSKARTRRDDGWDGIPPPPLDSRCRSTYDAQWRGQRKGSSKGCTTSQGPIWDRSMETWPWWKQYSH